MTYPIYRQDFESGGPPWTVATAAPELVDFDSAFSISTVTANAFTGNNSLSVAPSAAHSITSSGADTLGGDVTITAYVNHKDPSNIASYVYGQIVPAGQAPGANSYQRMAFTIPSGLVLLQSISGTTTTLNPGITNTAAISNIGYVCLELRCHGTTISGRAIRQDTGQFFQNVGSGSWASTPYSATGTATLAPAAGSYGLRLGDATGCFTDDLIYGPGAPSVDVPTFTLNSIGATQQLTAGGFSDPLFGVTWGSSNTGVATVSAGGLVTAVAVGTATITATGKRDTGQTATAAATVATTPVTVLTSTPPTPASGYAHNPSTAMTFALGVGSLAGSVVVTPNDSGGGGTFSPTTLTLTNTTRSGTVTYTPAAAAVFAIGCTNSSTLANPATFNYTGTAQGFAVAPTAYQVGTAVTAAFTGTGTLWLTTPPTITASGIPCTVGSATVTTNTACTALVTPGSTQGTVTFTDSTSGAITTATVGPVVPTFAYLSSVAGFASGLVGSVGRTILDSTGATYAARSTSGVFAVGTSGYAGLSQVPTTGQYLVLWDDGSGHQAWQETPVYSGGPVQSVTAPVTLPPIPANWLSAAGIAAGALAGKGDWLAATSYVLPPTPGAIASAVLTTQMIESYNADGISPTLAQSLYLIMQRLIDFSTVGNLVSVRKIDGSTTAYQLTYTLDTNQNPVAVTRSS